MSTRKGCNCDACNYGFAVGQLWVSPTATRGPQTIVIIDIEHVSPGWTAVLDGGEKHYRMTLARWLFGQLNDNEEAPWAIA